MTEVAGRRSTVLDTDCVKLPCRSERSIEDAESKNPFLSGVAVVELGFGADVVMIVAPTTTIVLLPTP